MASLLQNGLKWLTFQRYPPEQLEKNREGWPPWSPELGPPWCASVSLYSEPLPWPWHIQHPKKKSFVLVTLPQVIIFTAFLLANLLCLFLCLLQMCLGYHLLLLHERFDRISLLLNLRMVGVGGFELKHSLLFCRLASERAVMLPEMDSLCSHPASHTVRF